MKKIVQKIGVYLSAFALTFSTTAVTAQAATTRAIYTVSGIVFHDVNKNGTLDLKKVELPVKNQEVALYANEQDANNNSNVIKTTKSNSAGIYAFKALAEGNYVVKYTSTSSDYSPIAAPNNIMNENNEAMLGFVSVSVSGAQKISTSNLPLKRQTDISITPFIDANWNGAMDSSESIANGRTMICVDIMKLAQDVKSGALNNFDVNSLISSDLLSGNINILNSIAIRTTANNKAIQLQDVPAGVWVALRSPLNLTSNILSQNQTKLEALIDIITNKNIAGILNNPELISTGDIDTNNDNTYIKLLASTFDKMIDETSKINFETVLSEKHTSTVRASLAQLKGIGTLMNSIPAFRIAVIDYYGNAYDITGLKFRKTNNLLFGIKEYASISGKVFKDLDYDGQLGKLELLGATSIVRLYDENGQEKASATTSNSSASYKFEKINFNTIYYIGVETSNQVNPLVSSSELPDALKDKKIVKKVYIDQYDTESALTQNIAVPENVSSNIKVSLKSTNTTNKTTTFEFANSSWLSSATVYYSVNGGSEVKVDIGRNKKVSVTVNAENAENTLDIYVKKGIYNFNIAQQIY